MKPTKSVLPASDIDAPDLVCLRLNAEWLDILATAVSRYEWPVSWKPGTDITRAEQQIFKFYEMLRNVDVDCCEDVCIDYPPSESFIEYFPQNPFTEPDLTPGGYNAPPFYVDNAAVYTSITRVSANPLDWPAIITAGLPRIRVNVTGAIKVGLGLVSIFAGGIIFITKDDDITTSKWYSLTSIGLIDVVAIVAAIPALIEGLFSGDSTPEEIYQDETIEIFFDTPGDHHIDITFLPRVSPETIIGFGGGLRKIELCGQQRPVMEFRQNPDDNCQLQYRTSAASSWVLMFDYGVCMTNNCCDEPPALLRYTGDGTLERSTDGGATYTPAPEYDPRNNSPQFPPAAGADGSDKRCIAATGAALLMKAQVANQLTDDMSHYTLAQLFTDWTKTVIDSGGNIFQALVTIAANQTFAVGIAALRAALTTTVWDTMQCILYCNMASNASFNNAQWQAVKSDIASQIGGIASLFLQQLVNVLGAVGLTNLARSGGAAAGDCADCHCDDTWCYEIDLTLNSGAPFLAGYHPASDGGVYYNTSWVDGTGYITANPSPNYTGVRFSLDEIPGLRHFEFLGSGVDLPFIGVGDTETGDSVATGYTSQFRDFDGTETHRWIYFGKRDVSAITYIKFSGVGTNPFGSNNC